MEPWIETYTGKKFHPFNPSSDEIDIEDIAHSLSLLCRFNGHCKEFYSVAQHSVLACDYVGEKDKLATLLHDASEAYLCDIPKPIKACMPDYNGWERNLLGIIYDKFWVNGYDYAAVKRADAIMLANEARDLMVGNLKDWHLTEAPRGKPIPTLSSHNSEWLFLGSFKEYSNG